MRYVLFLVVSITVVHVYAQALQDINYSYLYNPDGKFTFHIKPVRTEQKWIIFYNLELKSDVEQNGRYAIQWEKRNGLNDKEGDVMVNDSLTEMSLKNSGSRIEGRITVDKSHAPKILVARVIDNTDKVAWIFYTFLLPEYPVNCYLEDAESKPLLKSYFDQGSQYSIRGEQDQNLVISYYDKDFPAGAPAFSEGLARVPTVIRPDSIFRIKSNQEATYAKPGLYLVQKDTSSKDGLAFRVYDDYPKYAKLENLADPLIYICTRQESERLKESRGDKKSFDRVILNITGNTERARNFMRSYFRRVELANQYFSSYKEGWKTDRGMIYIIFGLPDEVYKFADREVWTYKSDEFKVTFDFVRSPSVFDPENFVLVRHKKFQTVWYQVVDLWRNARF